MQTINSEPIASYPIISLHNDNSALKVEIETDRLYIRSYLEEDFENYVSLYGDTEITKYFDHGKPRSRLETEKLIEETGNKYFREGEPFGSFSIFDKKTMAFIGQVDLVPCEEPGSVEIGCILCRPYQGMGYSKEAIRALVVDYVNELNNKNFNSKYLPIEKVIATAHPDNAASHKIVKGLEMKFDKFQERFGNPRLWYSYVPKPDLNNVEN